MLMLITSPCSSVLCRYLQHPDDGSADAGKQRFFTDTYLKLDTMTDTRCLSSVLYRDLVPLRVDQPAERDGTAERGPLVLL